MTIIQLFAILDVIIEVVALFFLLIQSSNPFQIDHIQFPKGASKDIQMMEWGTVGILCIDEDLQGDGIICTQIDVVVVVQHDIILLILIIIINVVLILILILILMVIVVAIVVGILSQLPFEEPILGGSGLL